MAGQSRKWMILVATIWIQAFTGTNFDFSAYSSELKAVLTVSQVQLNYLATASDLGKVLGWSSGLALMYLPLWAVMFTAALMGLVGYGLQWLIINNIIVLPYFVVFLLCLLAGCSICWFNTVCFILCIKNFPSNQPLALSLSVSFNGLSAAFYNLAAKSFNPSSTTLYLLLNALIPLFISLLALFPILSQRPINTLSSDAIKRDQFIFIALNFWAVVIGFYLLFFRPLNVNKARLLFVGAMLLLVLPFAIPGVMYARDWFHREIYSNFELRGSGFILIDADELELHKELINQENSADDSVVQGCSWDSVIKKDCLTMLGEEHKAQMLVRRLDFWLYYVGYLCGGTIGLVYSNNLGQIAQSLGYYSMTPRLITTYSAFSFFGRLLSAAPDFARTKLYFARTGWLAVALLLMPVAYCLLAANSTAVAIEVGTALIGLTSGFIFAAAVSITSELFGPNSVGVNHNILITNIPIGSLLYGVLSAVVYDSNAVSIFWLMGDSVVCMGKQCYGLTFVLWGCISMVGLASSVLLFLRTKHVYDKFEQNRKSELLY